MPKPPKKKFVHLAEMAPGAARNRRVAALVRNPGTRSKVPDALLPARYRAGRATAKRVATENATLYNPAQILSGKDLRSAVKSEVDLQINPQIKAYEGGIKSLTGQRDVSQQRLGQYFDLYNKSTAASAAGLSSSGQQLAEQLSGLGQRTQDTLTGIQGDIDRRNAADVALRGPGLQDTAGAAQAVNFEKAQAAGATQSYLGQGAAQSAGASELAGTIAAVAPMRAGDAQAILSNKFNQQIMDMQSKRAEVEASRGDLTTTTLNKMRNDQFTNLATMKGLDIKQSDLRETVRKNKATEALTGAAINQRDVASRRTARSAHERAVAKRFTDQANLDIKRGVDPITGKPLPKKPESAADALNRARLKFFQAHGYMPTTGPPKGKGKNGDVPKLPPATRAGKITEFRQAAASVKRGISALGGLEKTPRSKAATTFLDSDTGKKVDPLFASIALDVQYDGHVSRANARKLKNMGLTVKDLGVPSYQEWLRSGKKRSNKSRVAGAGKGKVGSGAFPPINLG